MTEGISVWSYKTTKGTRWAFEVRQPLLGKKTQRRGFRAAPEAKRHAKQLKLEQTSINKAHSQGDRVVQLVQDYLTSLSASVRPNTLANYKLLLDKYFLPEFGNRRISSIQEPEISALLQRLTSQGLLPGTVNTVRSRIIGLFSYAVRRRVLIFNSAKETRTASHSYEGRTAVSEPLTGAEAIELLRRAKSSEIDLFVCLCLGLGLRKGEALGLRLSDVDFEHGLLFIRRSRGPQRYIASDGSVRSTEQDGQTKTGHSVRSVPMNRVVLESLLRSNLSSWAEPDTYLVSTKAGAPLALSRLHKSYKALFEPGGLRYVRIHDLRHTAAVLALEGKAPLEAVSQSLGHRSLEITKRIYAPRVKSLDEVFAMTLGRVLGSESVPFEAIEGGVLDGLGSESLGG